MHRVTAGERHRRQFLLRLAEVTANSSVESDVFGELEISFHEQVRTFVRRLDVVNGSIIIGTTVVRDHRTNFVALACWRADQITAVTGVCRSDNSRVRVRYFSSVEELQATFRNT